MQIVPPDPRFSYDRIQRISFSREILEYIYILLDYSIYIYMEQKQPRVLYFSARGQLGCNPIAVNARTLKNRTSRPPRRGWNSLWDPLDGKRRKDKRARGRIESIRTILSIIFAYRILKRAPPRDARTHAIRNNGDLTVIRDIYIYTYTYI